MIFDVDGTLYHARRVRLRMVARLLAAHALAPRLGWRTIRALSAYRAGQEALRASDALEDLAAAQIEHACRASGAAADELAGWVRRWMEEAPLDLLAPARRPGLVELLEAARARGLRLGVLSDYPPHAKLEALGVRAHFEALGWAQEREVGVFKPDPRGLLRVARALGAEPQAVLYVGDRPEVDARAAQAAGIPCAILGPRRSPPREPWRAFAGCAELARWLFGSQEPRA